MKLPQACVFDAYGTLFDYASAAARCGGIPDAQRDSLSRLWREKQLQYTWLRTLQDQHADFWQVTGDALDFTLETLGLTAPDLREKLMQSYLTLDPFPEVRAVLERLRAQGIKTAILSNGSREMLQAAVAGAGMERLFDAVLSVDEVGVYKPHPKVYQLAVDRLGIERQAISYHSSNAWDAWAASAFGMRVVWCTRYGSGATVVPSVPERLPGHPEHRVTSLLDLPFLREVVNSVD